MTAGTDDIDTSTPSRRAARNPAPGAGLVAYVAAAAFVVAAVWYGLAARFITVARPPAFNPDAPLDAELHRWFNWFVTTIPQERIDAAIAIAGFLCLLPLAAFVRDLLGRDRTLVRIGSQALPAGALLWVAGNVMQVGGHRAVGLMATHRDPIETVNAILFTVDTIDDAFELAAFAVLGVALLALAGAAVAGPIGDRAVPRAWCGHSLLLGAVLLALSVAHAVGGGDVVDLLLVVGGGLLLPAWLVWTGRLLRNATTSRAIPRFDP
ncbi:MAG TPA: hypothetical protein VFA45_18305 [Actinomycetes bacterium]|jgi:hypothetical protein|nr:hypothetical protein [Actinomycetes bacterium]